jgi:hypothetical protein
MYGVYEKFLEKVFSDPTVGGRLQKARVKIRFNYTDPEGSVFLNFADPPEKEGMFGSYKVGECEDEADVTMTQSADFSHRFWQGKENGRLPWAKSRHRALCRRRWGSSRRSVPHLKCMNPF